jgi:hypothetical protein
VGGRRDGCGPRTQGAGAGNVDAVAT